MVTTVGRRSVVGMLAGARMAQQISFHAACRFFSHAVWDIDRLGLVVARMVVTRLLGPGEPVTVVIDDTLFERWGRHVHGAHWTHDGANITGVSECSVVKDRSVRCGILAGVTRPCLALLAQLLPGRDIPGVSASIPEFVEIIADTRAGLYAYKASVRD